MTIDGVVWEECNALYDEDHFREFVLEPSQVPSTSNWMTPSQVPTKTAAKATCHCGKEIYAHGECKTHYMGH